MLLNTAKWKVTDFTVSELLKGNQQGVGIKLPLPPTEIKDNG